MVVLFCIFAKKTTMMSNNIPLGKLGEDLATQFLINKGYMILERNWRSHHKEVDIIALDGKTLVIVEVKTRKSDEYGLPDLAVNKRKQRLLISAANAYILSHPIDLEARFDIISIYFEGENAVIEHYEDAFQPLF